jgi:hypothetical protein
MRLTTRSQSETVEGWLFLGQYTHISLLLSVFGKDGMGTRADVEWCAFATVCVVSPHGRACLPSCLDRASDELLLAIVQQELHVFARRSNLLSPSCGCRSGGGGSLQGFVCPHVATYDDVAHLLTIPLASIEQLFMTFRTAPSVPATGTTPTGKGVATRTKDLVIRTTTALVLWVEFEHNLARGWFLEALTSSSMRVCSQLDMDYLDLSDVAAVETMTRPARSSHTMKIEFAPTPPQAPSLLVFLRDAWRHVMYDKVKLALQVAHDTPSNSEDPTVAALLTTAMELSTRLDEPDLNAFTWLTSGFLQLRQASGNPTTRDLAVAEVLHSLTLAREHSLEYLTCLALQCVAGAYVDKPETVGKARELLTEATKLLTLSSLCGAMEPSLKMQLHAMLCDLNSSPQELRRPSVLRAHSVLSSGSSASAATKPREQLAVVRSDSSSRLLDKPEKKPTTRTFSLWAHIFGNGRSRTDGGDAVKPLLLARVVKPLDQRGPGGSLCVDVLGAHGVHKARFRVYVDETMSIAWLQDHVATRYKAVVVGSEEGESDPVVALFYDPQRKELVPKHIVVSQWIPLSRSSLSQDQYTLHAKLAPRVVSSHRTASTEQLPLKQHDSKTDDDAPEGRSVLCSLCGRRIPLSDVEDHSETCF